MAASVRIEDEAFSDRRYERLAREAGLTDADHARGKMAVLWRQCTLEGRHVLPLQDVLDVLGPRALEALREARLGDEVRGGVRIRGTRGRIEWLERLRENGRKGGRPRKAPTEPNGSPSGSLELNPPAPAPAPAPALVLTQKEEKRESERPAPPARPRKAQRQPMPSDWTPDETGRLKARALGLDVEREVAEFRDWTTAKGMAYADWQAGFRSHLASQAMRPGRAGPQPVRDRAAEIFAMAQTLEDDS